MKNQLDNLLTSLPAPIVSHIKHLERMREDFVANVSHELRTPLTVIHGYLEVLLDQAHSPAHEKIYKQMYQQTSRMQNLIADLLLLSSLEKDEQKIHFTELVDVSKMLSMIVEEAKALSGGNHEININTDSILKIRGDESELRMLFSNLIFNSVKYTPAGGKIHIVWKKEGKSALFEVSDTGIGIEEKHLPRITERFYRVDKARSRDSGGTGLGLAIAKHILIRHEGELHIESELGKGSIFRCIF